MLISATRDEIIYYLVAFILGWLASRMMENRTGNGFNIGGQDYIGPQDYNIGSHGGIALRCPTNQIWDRKANHCIKDNKLNRQKLRENTKDHSPPPPPPYSPPPVDKCLQKEKYYSMYTDDEWNNWIDTCCGGLSGKNAFDHIKKSLGCIGHDARRTGICPNLGKRMNICSRNMQLVSNWRRPCRGDEACQQEKDQNYNQYLIYQRSRGKKEITDKCKKQNTREACNKCVKTECDRLKMKKKCNDPTDLNNIKETVCKKLPIAPPPPTPPPPPWESQGRPGGFAGGFESDDDGL